MNIFVKCREIIAQGNNGRDDLCHWNIFSLSCGRSFILSMYVYIMHGVHSSMCMQGQMKGVS